MKTSPPSSRALTLVETLVVIAVIAVLSAVLVPGLSSLRQRSEMTKTLHNLRQVGLGVFAYAQENSMTFPHEVRDSDGKVVLALSAKSLPGTGGSNWREAVHRYTGASFRPGSAYNFDGHPLWYTKNADPLGNHFGANPFITQDWWGCRLNRIPEPSKLVLLGEINHGSHVVDPRDAPVLNGSTLGRYRISHPGGMSLYMFADGHVEALKGPRNPNQTEHRSMWRFD